MKTRDDCETLIIEYKVEAGKLDTKFRSNSENPPRDLLAVANVLQGLGRENGLSVDELVEWFDAFAHNDRARLFKLFKREGTA